MFNLNKAIIAGNVIRKPELKSLPSGSALASFSVVTNRVFRKADGTKAEEPSFHNIVVFGKNGERCAQYLDKGATVLVEGHIQTRSWETEKGKQYRTEIVAEEVHFGQKPRTGSTQVEDTADIEWPEN